jgi:hypothetical protein
LVVVQVMHSYHVPETPDEYYQRMMTLDGDQLSWGEEKMTVA